MPLFQSLRNAKLIAHRGAPGYTPENTLISFQKAHELGAKWVEFDVMLTQDDVAIIMHDDTLDRTTNGRGNVADTTYQQIQSLDAGSWYAPQFAGERVPTFVELLHLLRKLDMHMEVEVKPTPGRGDETARVTIELLREHWPIDTHPPFLSSWDREACETIMKIAPDLIVGSVVHSVEEIDTAIDARVVSVNHQILDEKILSLLKKRYDLILPYTVNDKSRAQELLAMGADALFSDFPDLLKL